MALIAWYFMFPSTLSEGKRDGERMFIVRGSGQGMFIVTGNRWPKHFGWGCSYKAWTGEISTTDPSCLDAESNRHLVSQNLEAAKNIFD